MRLPDPPLLLITDRRQARLPLPDLAAAVFEAGCRWLSLREKDMAPVERRTLLQELVTLGAAYGATVGVHDDPEAAALTGAGALHLPAGGSPLAARDRIDGDILIGVSAHDLNEVVQAERAGADYVSWSPVFESLSKPGYGTGGQLGELARIVERTRLPVVALGGIHAGNAADCLRAGAAGVAVMGAVMAAERPAETVSRLLDSFG